MLDTLTAWGVGLALAIAISVPLGLLFGSVPALNTATRAIVEFLRPIPSVALIPLAGLLLGSGLNMKVALIVYTASWPILFNTMYGLDDVDPTGKETLRAFGFGRPTILWRVSLPSAAPFIATGVRLAAAIALILAVGTLLRAHLPTFIAGLRCPGELSLRAATASAGFAPTLLAGLLVSLRLRRVATLGA